MSTPSGVPLAACSARAARRHRSSAGSAAPRSWRARRPSVAAFEVQRVAPVDQHEHRLQQVVAVVAAADDMQEQVQLGRRRHVVQRAQRPSRSGALQPDPQRRPAGGCRARRSDDPPSELRQVDLDQPSCSKPALGRRHGSRRRWPRPPASQSNSAASGSGSPNALARQCVEVVDDACSPLGRPSTTCAGRPACRAPRGAERRVADAARPRCRDAAQLECTGDAARRLAGVRSTPTTGEPASRSTRRSSRRRAGGTRMPPARAPRARSPAARRREPRRAFTAATRSRAQRLAQHVVARRRGRAASRQTSRASSLLADAPTALRPGARRSRHPGASRRPCARGAGLRRVAHAGIRPSPGCR